MTQDQHSTTGPSLKYGMFLLAVTLLIYVQIVRFPFLDFDDKPFIIQNQATLQWKMVPTFFLGIGRSDPNKLLPTIPNLYRPVVSLWVVLNNKTFGLRPMLWRFSSLSLYLLGVWFFWRVAWKFLRDDFSAFAASVLYAIHPVHVEGVAWLSGANVEPVVAVFFFAGFFAYLRWRETGKTGWLMGCGILTLSALLSKETGMALPVLIVCHAFLFRPSPVAQADARARFVWLPMTIAVVIMVYLVMRFHAVQGLVMGGKPSHTWKEIFLTAPLLFVTYLKHVFWPVGLGTWYDLPVVRDPASLTFILPLAFCLAYVAVLIWSLVRRPFVGFMLLWWAVCLGAPIIGLRTFTNYELLHDRFTFIGLGGLCILVAAALRFLPAYGPRVFEVKATVAFATIFLMLGLGVLTVQQIYTWRSGLAMYARAVEVCPGCIRARILLADALLKEGKVGLAVALNRDTLRLEPDYWDAIYAYGLTLEAAGDRPEAIRILTHGIDLHPDNTPLYFALSRVLADGLDFDGSIQLLRQGIPKVDRPDILKSQLASVQEIQRRVRARQRLE